MPLDQHLGHADDRFRLVAEEPGALDLPLEHSGVRARVVARTPVLGEQVRGHLVHADVGALGGEDRGNEELEGVGVVQGARGSGIGPLQPPHDLARPGLQLLRAFLSLLHGRRFRANSRNSSALSVFSTSAAWSQPLRATPSPISMLAMPTSECASGPTANTTPS